MIKPKLLRPLHPNVGIEMAYRRALEKLITEMHDSVIYWIRARYRANEPHIATDALPANVLQKAMRALTRRWNKRFKDLSLELADYFAKDVSKTWD
jgi:hypothetical protein